MSDPYKFKAANEARAKASANTRSLFLEKFEELGASVKKTCEAIGIKEKTYSVWRSKDAEFRARIDEIRVRVQRETDGSTQPWSSGFGEFRLQFFGHESPWFHLLAVQAYESLPPGNILLILWPPEHGKTSLFEDYASYKLATDPTYRITVGSEKGDMSRKVLRRVKDRMEPGGGFPEYVARFGPFRPQKDARSVAQPWGSQFFDVYKKGSHDERDYSMVGIGFGSAIAGTRTDHLHVDDIQSRKSLNQTEEMVETFRQDWLTRPGETGITTINGTRVGEQDFYEVIMDELEDDSDSLLKVIKFPAIVYNEHTGEYEPLWKADEENPVDKPPPFTMDQLTRLRRKVGEEPWARNYMQDPLAGGNRTFSDEVLTPTLNQLRPIAYPPPPMTPCMVTIDPALGGKNCVMGLAMHQRMLKLIDFIEREGLTRIEQIVDDLVEMILQIQRQGGIVNEVIVETMAFQKAIMEDPHFIAARNTYGFDARPHMTGVNKYDANLGVPSMARDMRLGLIELPYADVGDTRHKIDETLRQFKRWKPLIKGNKLRQDRVMALWFGWIRWREMRGGEAPQEDASFNFAGLPYSPTNTGLYLPSQRWAA